MNSFCTARVAPEETASRPVLPLHLLPGVIGKHMTKMTYGQQLKHPNWQRKRLVMLEAAGWMCTCCGAKENTLHVHHKRYVKGRMAWEYEDIELDVLCDVCHLDEHALKELLDEMIAKSPDVQTLQSVVSLVAGYLEPRFSISDNLKSKAMDADPSAFFRGVLAGCASELPMEKVWEAIGAVTQMVEEAKQNPPQLGDVSAHA
jgi:hypothetical protein